MDVVIAVQEEPAVKPLVVNLRRDPFCDWLQLQVSDGSSEELDPEDARTWFKQRGANMDAVEKALDYCWNFYRATVIIKTPHKPLRSPLEPTI